MGLFGPSKREQEMQQEINRLRAMLSPQATTVIDLQRQIDELNATKFRIQEDCSNLQQQANTLSAQCRQIEEQIVIFQEEMTIQEYGIYKPIYEFANSDLYKDELENVRNQQKAMVKSGTAAGGNLNWTLNGNQKDGKKMVTDFQKLLIRAFNSECDSIISKVKYSNFEQSKKRITQSRDTISKLGKMMNIVITRPYFELKLKELTLAFEYAEKKQEEKEKLRELKAFQREEARIQKEIEEERKKLAKEEAHYQNALTTIRQQLSNDPNNADLLSRMHELEVHISDTQRAIADVDYREANRRAGYVYIISNIGAFGENVYKIGMTRRLEPMDRVNELGDASVPFNFDVHALIFSDDAPALETALHHAFDDKKVNKVNPRREFFRVSLDEIKKEVRKNFDKTVEWIDFPEAEQFRQSMQGGNTNTYINKNVQHMKTTLTESTVKHNTPTVQKPTTQNKSVSSQKSTPHSTQTQQQIPDNYCICCKRSGKFMQVNEEHLCTMCADTATEEQKLNAKREAGLI